MLRSLSIAALVASAVFAYPPNFPHDQPDQSNDETPYKKYVSDLALFREYDSIAYATASSSAHHKTSAGLATATSVRSHNATRSSSNSSQVATGTASSRKSPVLSTTMITRATTISKPASTEASASKSSIKKTATSTHAKASSKLASKASSASKSKKQATSTSTKKSASSKRASTTTSASKSTTEKTSTATNKSTSSTPSPTTSSASATSSTSAASCPTPNTHGSTVSVWLDTPCSGGKPIIDEINDMRSAWMPSLKNYPLEWDEAQVKAAWKTSTTVVGQGGNNMAHSLPVPQPGQSEGQNEAQGDDFSTNTTANALYPRGPFESATRLWLCELPQKDSISKDEKDGFHWPCDSTEAAGPPGSEAVGHAENLSNTGFTKVGCVYVEVKETEEDRNPGVWTCNYSNI